MSRARATGTFVGLSLLATAGCTLQFLPASGGAGDTPVNSCKLDADCGSNATCYQGACFAKSGIIDEVLLEVVPDANSRAGGLSYLQMQNNLASGIRDLAIDLPPRSSFVTQVVANAQDLPCGNGTGKQSIPARIEFVRTGAIGGVQVLSLTSTPLTIETGLNAGAWNAPVALVPGTYDIYVTPLVTDKNCAIASMAPRILRGIDVHQVNPAMPPALIELPTPAMLNCKVWREPTDSTMTLGSLEGWNVDIIEPQEGRVISTTISGPLGQTNAPPYWTNFLINYQKLTPPPAQTSTTTTTPASGPIVRISPPAAMADNAPTVYWDLAAVDLLGDGTCSLDMRGLPILPQQLKSVSGKIQAVDPRSPNGGLVGVRASLQFASQRIDGAEALTTVFQRTITTDENGFYSTSLFPGQYRVVIIPSASAQNNLAPPPTVQGTDPTGGATSPWALAEAQWMIIDGPNTLDQVLSSKRSLTGKAHVGLDTLAPAAGATLQANPVLAASDVGPLKGALGQVPVLPQNAGVSLRSDGTFRLPLDPGSFDLTITTPESSNLAWWVWPGAQVTLPTANSDEMLVSPEPSLPFPVPFEGVLTVPDATTGTAPLRGAAVRAYAKVPMGSGVTKVGETRTDDQGRFRLRLPPSFGP